MQLILTKRVAQSLTNDLLVYNPTTSAVASDQYSVSVKTTGDFKEVFTHQSKVPYSNPEDADNNTYYENLAGWSHSYANFVMGAKPVTVRITRKTGLITSAKIHPGKKVLGMQVAGNTVTFIMNVTTSVMVDINGMMELVSGDLIDPPPEKRTHYQAGRSLRPIHTISIHGNPPLIIPDITSASVYKVNAGTIRASYDKFASTFFDTMYFKPGVHYLGEDFKVFANRTYYIPGDAIVFGTFNNKDRDDAVNVTIIGHGTISGGVGANRRSGKEILHWKMRDYGIPVDGDDPDVKKFEEESYKKRPIHLGYCPGSTVEGITIADPANNSIIMHNPGNANRSYVKNVKVFGWRKNSDGGGCNDNSEVSNVFFRCQDDGVYPNGKVLRDSIFWTDSNGANMRLSSLPNFTDGRRLVIRNIECIFRRNMWWSNSGFIEVPSMDEGDRGKGILFSNITISDPKPVRPPIKIHQNGGTFSGTRFENITITRLPRYVNGSIMKNELFALPGAKIENILFVNTTIEGVKVTPVNWRNYFETKGDVSVTFA